MKKSITILKLTEKPVYLEDFPEKISEDELSMYLFIKRNGKEVEFDYLLEKSRENDQDEEETTQIMSNLIKKGYLIKEKREN